MLPTYFVITYNAMIKIHHNLMVTSDSKKCACFDLLVVALELGQFNQTFDSVFDFDTLAEILILA